MAKVFISYSSKQFREASQVCEYLERHGVLCWMAPRNIDPGSNYASQIVQAIRDSSALVLESVKKLAVPLYIPMSSYGLGM